MGAMPATPTMTADEFIALPDAPDLRFAELVAGELVVDAPRARHQLIAGELMSHLMSWVRGGQGRGSVWFDLERPDVLTSSLLEGFELPLVELFKPAR
jgi:Putative restriction endonuclease